MRRKHPIWLVSIFLSLTLLAAACGGNSKKSSSGSNTTVASSKVQKGGTITLGWEQEPDCTDWIGSCGGSTYGAWMGLRETLPRAYDFVEEGGKLTYKPSILLTGEADLKTDPKQVVTYHISPKAVWSDGQPVTSTDFKYLWQQIATGADIYDTTGYSNIASVNDSDPATAVVTFSTVFADWKSLFGGGYGLLPSHLLQGKDRAAEVANGYKFSGGPWMIESWNKGADLTLVPNPKYWGKKPNLDKVVFKFIPDTAAEFQAFKGGEVDAIAPQPQPDAIDQIKAGLTGKKSKFQTDTVNLEAIWFNNAKAPFTDVKVRQAVSYAIDRDAVVNRLFGPLGVTKAMQTMVPLVAKPFATTAWSKYKKDTTKVDELLTSAGYAKGSDGLYAKGGQKLTFEIATTTGNARRALTLQIIQDQLKQAGIGMTISTHKSGDLFGSILPKGDYQAGLYANTLTALAPSTCNQFCAKNIPTAPKFSGQNWSRANTPAAEAGLKAMENELDVAKQIAGSKSAEPAMADGAVVLPLDPLPNVFLWSDKLVGPVSTSGIDGPLWNLEEWGVKA
ncbi:MAG: peptide/nickel transport system substrate-binding protein [Actinomycetota bacterium]|nr:peptide/nickel transport system substrate-binding protein [Actinomycetota bacterium]